ncbi:HK97 gp10 family phage protein [Marinicrinis sediminis]|uniref:HK97 gp10 family phage protein n=1 Tax=Marinicrinis sediminis TaxID=1652465 RepID=A0ABW5RAN6_9BACL
MNDDFDLRELDDFAMRMLELAEETMPRETKKFLRVEGSKLRKLTLKNAKSSVKKDTGNYFKGIKRGKLYTYNGNQSIRVYGASPHAHLIEHGHRMVSEDGQEVGFVRGKKVFQKSLEEFEQEYIRDCQEFIDDLLNEGLR